MIAYLALLAGLALWAAAHGLKIHASDRRAALAAQYGDGAVKLAMTLAILASVALMVWGYQAAPYDNLWFPPGWTVHLNNLAMVIAFAIYAAGAIPGHLRAWIRHPQLTGVKIWAAAHLLVNGDLASVILFGGLLAWAVVALVGVNKRDGKGPKPEAGPIWWDAVNLAVALALVAGVGWLHAYLGVWPFPGAPG